MKRNYVAIISLFCLCSCKPQCSDVKDVCVKMERIKVVESPYAVGVAIGVFHPIMGMAQTTTYEDNCLEYKQEPNESCIKEKLEYEKNK